MRNIIKARVNGLDVAGIDRPRRIMRIILLIAVWAVAYDAQAYVRIHISDLEVSSNEVETTPDEGSSGQNGETPAGGNNKQVKEDFIGAVFIRRAGLLAACCPPGEPSNGCYEGIKGHQVSELLLSEAFPLDKCNQNKCVVKETPITMEDLATKLEQEGICPGVNQKIGRFPVGPQHKIIPALVFTDAEVGGLSADCTFGSGSGDCPGGNVIDFVVGNFPNIHTLDDLVGILEGVEPHAIITDRAPTHYYFSNCTFTIQEGLVCP
jgi:hypothetical protein